MSVHTPLLHRVQCMERHAALPPRTKTAEKAARTRCNYRLIFGPAHLYKDNEGKLWIHKARVKITTHKESCTCNVPLLEPALVILEKYKDWNPENPEGPCFPIPSNQKMNEFLKEIATLCRVNKRLTVHVARHTFATTVTLANDVALQNVSKMLGHSSTRMTQHYARVLDNSIMKDMQDVSRVFG